MNKLVCSHSITSEEDQIGPVCLDCGTLLSSSTQHHLLTDLPGLSSSAENVMQEEQQRKRNNASKFGNRQFITLKSKTYEERKLSMMRRNLRQISHVLKIQSIEQRIWFLYEQYQQKGCRKNRFGKAGILSLGACIYVGIRERKLPITLPDIWNILSLEYGNIDFFELGNIYKNVAQTLNLDISPVNLSTFIEKIVGELPETVMQENHSKISERAHAIANLAEECLLNQGRNESALAVAVVVLAVEADKGIRLAAKDVTDLGDTLTCSRKQVLTRYQELKKTLLEFGSQFPFFKDITSANMYRMLGSLIDFGFSRGWKSSVATVSSTQSMNQGEEGLMSSSDQVGNLKSQEASCDLRSGLKSEGGQDYPPSYVKSLKLTTITRDRIEKVKELLKKEGSDVAPWNISFISSAVDLEALEEEFKDPKDAVIAKYLLDGFSSQEILDFNPIFGQKKKRH